MHKHGESGTQVDHRVRFDAGLAATKLRPGKQLQTQVDGGRVDCECVNLQPSQVRVDGQFDPRRSDHRHCRVHEDAEVAALVGIRQRAACRRNADAAVIPTRTERTQATDCFAQAGANSELREDHAEQLIHAGEATGLFLPGIPLDGPVESSARKQIEELSEDGAAIVHPRMVAGIRRKRAEDRRMKLKSCTLTSEQKTLWKSSYAEPNATDSPDNSDLESLVAEFRRDGAGGRSEWGILLQDYTEQSFMIASATHYIRNSSHFFAFFRIFKRSWSFAVFSFQFSVFSEFNPSCLRAFVPFCLPQRFWFSDRHSGSPTCGNRRRDKSRPITQLIACRAGRPEKCSMALNGV